jgi:hypothetical protein
MQLLHEHHPTERADYCARPWLQGHIAQREGKKISA